MSTMRTVRSYFLLEKSSFLLTKDLRSLYFILFFMECQNRNTLPYEDPRRSQQQSASKACEDRNDRHHTLGCRKHKLLSHTGYHCHTLQSMREQTPPASPNRLIGFCSATATDCNRFFCVTR